MKARTLLFSALFLILATSVSAAPSTVITNEVSPGTSLIGSINSGYIGNGSGNNDKGIIGPRTIGANFNGSGKDSDGTDNSLFIVPGGYGYVKIYFKNSYSSPVKVVVTHDKTNKTYVAQTIPGNGSYTWLSTDDNPQGVRSGRYEVLFRGGGDGTKPVDASWKGFATDNTNDF